MVDTFLQEKLQLKFSNMDFIGLPYLKIHVNFVKLVKAIKNWDQLNFVKLIKTIKNWDQLLRETRYP